ncbi:aconitase/3-isopropylmalate dehydratase large subunit family protein [Pseudoroseomonas globiformis]|uniref:3-isopropylmalate dehydratase large subunit n=1 Tax=Teichococcus globiformis TaxID=2307229 RepID=A0ABV7G5C4_9PROT
MTGRSISEKILATHCLSGEIRPGAIATIRPDTVLLNDVSGPLAFENFAAMGAKGVFDPSRIVLVADHFAPAPDITAAGAIRMTQDFAKAQGIEHYYDPGRGGIEHTLLAELGMIGHGQIVFGADSHTCTAGAFNGLGIGFGSTDLAAALATGQLWMRVPDTIRVELVGTLPHFTAGKDIILELIRRIGTDGAADAALEFGGPGVATLSMDARMAVANMAVEAGADWCVFEGDDLSLQDMAARGMTPCPPVLPDADAVYRDRLTIELDGLAPVVARPPSPAAGASLEALRGQKVDQVYVGNCANGTITDLRQVAEILRGRRIAPGVRMVVVPATQRIWRKALAEGLLDLFAEAGAAVSTPTCGACFGGHMGILAAGETAIATTNRNFRGRMGHPDSQVFLANAWVAAAAAVAGEIIPPGELPPIPALEAA